MNQLAVMVDVFLAHIFVMVKMIVVTIVTKLVDVSLIFLKSLLLRIILFIYLEQGGGGKEIFFALFGKQMILAKCIKRNYNNFVAAACCIAYFIEKENPGLNNNN